MTLEARHTLKTLDLRDVLQPFNREVGSPEYLRHVAPLIQLLVTLPALIAQVPWALGSILQQGYFFWGVKRLEDLLDKYLPDVAAILAKETPEFRWPTTTIEWLTAIDQVTASPWPLMAGNVCRRYANQYMLDITGCSHAFLQRLEMSRAPALGNLRGAAFELQCQDIIDRSPWAPPPPIRELRGRTLWRAGQKLTDIDALATRDGILLIVSGKSRIYDREYDRGTYRVVENERNRLDEAVTQWDLIVESLNREPVGDNFDFSAFEEIVGIVCTPFPVYTHSERSLRFVRAGLRASSSTHELLTGCNSIHLRSRCPDYGGPLLPTMRRTSVRVFPWKEPLSAKKLERCRISRATTTVASRQRTWAKLSCFLAPGEALRRVAHRRSDQDSGIRRSRGRVSPSWKMSVKKAPFRLSSR